MSIGRVIIGGSGAAPANVHQHGVARIRIGGHGHQKPRGYQVPGGPKRKTVVCTQDGVPHAFLANARHGDVTWEANLVAAHHRLAVTPMYFEDGSGNTEWMAAHGAFHAALAAAAGSPVLERLRRQLYDASELYRYWAGVLPHHPTRVYVADEHKAVFDAALARDADLAVDLLTQHLETTARNLEAIAPDVDAEPSALGPRRTDSNRPGTTAPVR